jgi:hypothetical protein
VHHVVFTILKRFTSFKKYIGFFFKFGLGKISAQCTCVVLFGLVYRKRIICLCVAYTNLWNSTSICISGRHECRENGAFIWSRIRDQESSFMYLSVDTSVLISLETKGKVVHVLNHTPISGVRCSAVFPGTLNRDTVWSVMSPLRYGRFNSGVNAPVSKWYATGSAQEEVWLSHRVEPLGFSGSQCHFFCRTLSTTVVVPMTKKKCFPSSVTWQLNPMEQSPWQANSQLIKHFHTIYGTRTFSTVLRSARNWNQWIRPKS